MVIPFTGPELPAASPPRCGWSCDCWRAHWECKHQGHTEALGKYSDRFMRKEAWKWNTSVISTGEDGGYETLRKTRSALRILFLFTMCAARSDFFFLRYFCVNLRMWAKCCGISLLGRRWAAKGFFWSVVHKNVLCQKNQVSSSMKFLSCPLREIWWCDWKISPSYIAGLECMQFIMQTLTRTLTTCSITTLYSGDNIQLSAYCCPFWSPPLLHFNWNRWITYDPNSNTNTKHQP